MYYNSRRYLLAGRHIDGIFLPKSCLICIIFLLEVHMTVPKIVESIFADTANFPEEGMSQTAVICLVLKHQNKKPTHENIKSQQSNVSRALTKLVGDKRVILEDRTYYPVTPETVQQEALTQFSENVYCTKPDIFAIVDTMYLIKVHSDHVYAATEYLRRYLGPDRYFDIFYANSYLWVLWESKNNDEDEFRNVYQEICKAVSASYDHYLDSQRKLRKLQKEQEKQSSN